MADISDNGSFNLGLANIASQNSGATAVTNQASTAAGTELTKQQTAGAQIANQSARLQYQLFASAMNHLTDFSGQDGPTHNADDSSGVTPTSALPSPSSPQAKQAMSRVTPEDDIGASASDRALIESSLEQSFNVNPMGTQQEQQAIIQARQYASLMELSGNKGMAASAQARLEMLKDQRDMNVGNRRNAAALEASQHYDKLSAVVNAPEGKAWDTLQTIAPDSAKSILRQ